jgi:RNA polymerase sigma-70 factor (ECF subfamily)
MTGDDAGAITRLLIEWQAGDKAALERLTPLVYHELHRLAAAYLRRERLDHTLQPTALIHEAYIRLVQRHVPAFTDRVHFYGLAAHLMRQILVDFARARKAAKRGAGRKIALDGVQELAIQPAADDDVLTLHDALVRLADFDARKARVIELRYFGGLTRDEVAGVLGLTLATVKRDLALAEAWLRREMTRVPSLSAPGDSGDDA